MQKENIKKSGLSLAWRLPDAACALGACCLARDGHFGFLKPLFLAILGYPFEMRFCNLDGYLNTFTVYNTRVL